jgi:hypothetical protein
MQSDVKMINVKKNWIKPFGDGKTAERISDALRIK